MSLESGENHNQSPDQSIAENGLEQEPNELDDPIETYPDDEHASDHAEFEISESPRSAELIQGEQAELVMDGPREGTVRPSPLATSSSQEKGSPRTLQTTETTDTVEEREADYHPGTGASFMAKKKLAFTGDLLDPSSSGLRHRARPMSMYGTPAVKVKPSFDEDGNPLVSRKKSQSFLEPRLKSRQPDGGFFAVAEESKHDLVLRSPNVRRQIEVQEKKATKRVHEKQALQSGQPIESSETAEGKETNQQKSESETDKKPELNMKMGASNIADVVNMQKKLDKDNSLESRNERYREIGIKNKFLKAGNLYAPRSLMCMELNSKPRLWAIWLTETKVFENFILFCILLNMVSTSNYFYYHY